MIPFFPPPLPNMPGLSVEPLSHFDLTFRRGIRSPFAGTRVVFSPVKLGGGFPFFFLEQFVLPQPFSPSDLPPLLSCGPRQA